MKMLISQIPVGATFDDGQGGTPILVRHHGRGRTKGTVAVEVRYPDGVAMGELPDTNRYEVMA